MKTREELTAEWHQWCQANQRLVDRIPTFKEWLHSFKPTQPDTPA